MTSPLLFPVKRKNKKILVLDETQFPFKEFYIEVSSLEEALEVLRSMKTRSLGQVLLFFYCCLLFKDNCSVEEIVRKFSQARPTFDFVMLGQILKKGVQKTLSLEQIINGFVSSFDKARRKRAKRLADILPKQANILTICNVNGELVYLYEEIKKLGKDALFYVSETRPYLQGSRLTFWELRKNNIPAKLVCDNQVAVLMKEEKVNCVVTGADRATKRGDIINKVGTYSIAILAKHFNIPFYPLTQYPRDIDIDSIEIEQRPGNEAFMYLRGDFSAIKAFYPAFDVTKKELVTQGIELELK